MEINLSDDQQAAFRKFTEWIASDKKEFRLGGLAGTGKTTIVRKMLEQLSSYEVIAPTAKAALVLQSKGVPANTSHSLLCRFEQEAFVDGKKQLVFSDKKVRYEFIVVDESSMITSDMRKRILNCGNRVIWVGDYGQLPPVESNISPFEKSVVDESLLDVKLTEQHRHKGNSELIDFANFVRLGNHPVAWNAKEENVLINPLQSANPETIADYLIKNNYLQAICYTRNACMLINKEVRKLKGFRATVEPGDRIICCRNNYSNNIANGQIFTCQSEVYGTITTECGKRFGYTFDENNRAQNTVIIDYGYAITCHKAQGSEWESVCVIEDRSASKEWRYTAATRSQKGLVYFV